HSLEEGVEDFIDRLLDERRGVVNDAIIQTGREPLAQFLHPGADRVGHVEGVRAGELEDAEARRRLAVEARGYVRVERRQLDAGNVVQADDRRGRDARVT